jgi:hypothetical protein
MIACLEDAASLTDALELLSEMSARFFSLREGVEEKMKKTVRVVLVVPIPKVEKKMKKSFCSS